MLSCSPRIPSMSTVPRCLTEVHQYLSDAVAENRINRSCSNKIKKCYMSKFTECDGEEAKNLVKTYAQICFLNRLLRGYIIGRR